MTNRSKIMLGMLFTFLFTFAIPSFARDYDDRDRGYWRGGARDDGYRNGYQDGRHHGQEDRDRRTAYNMRSRDYKKADRGYEKYMGHKDDYKDGYRQGYQTGYDEGYNRGGGFFGGIFGRRSDRDRDRYGRWSYDWGNNRRTDFSGAAFNNGYRDGLDDGGKDVRKNKRFDPDDHGDYRDADNGYHGEYGSKEAYRQEYRRGYLQGYREAFGGPYRR